MEDWRKSSRSEAAVSALDRVPLWAAVASAVVLMCAVAVMIGAL